MHFHGRGGGGMIVNKVEIREGSRVLAILQKFFADWFSECGFCENASNLSAVVLNLSQALAV
jgi:hypothetical protein